MTTDPNEWHNMAASAEHAAVVQEHRKWLPSVNRKPVSGSRDRILLYDPASGTANWEGREIAPGDPIPEIED